MHFGHLVFYLQEFFNKVDLSRLPPLNKTALLGKNNGSNVEVVVASPDFLQKLLQ